MVCPLRSSPRYVLRCDARWSPYRLPGKCEVKNAGSVRTFELFPYTLYVLCAPKKRTPYAPAFSINCMLPPSPPSSLVMPLSLGNYAVALSVARVKPGGFSPTISNYIFTSPRSKLSPLVFRPLGRGQGDAIEKQEKRILLS